MQAWSEIIYPYLKEQCPELLETAFVAIGSSVAYGLADEHSDIDMLLILPINEYVAREKEWIEWAYNAPELAAFSHLKHVRVSLKISTWRKEGVSILFDGNGCWDEFYNGHQHWVMTLIPIHDPQNQMQVIRQSLTQMPEGLAERAAERCVGQLEDLRCTLQLLNARCQEHFVGLLGYSIATRALHLLFHRQKAPLPFHKWQWPLAERLSEESRAVLRELRVMLEEQAGGVSFPEGLIGKDVRRIPSREFPLPSGVSLAPDAVQQALASIQWHLEERGCYQMVRARARGWRGAALQYMCASRCLLIKGAILLETGQIVSGEDVSAMWGQVRDCFPDLEDCLWPGVDEGAFERTLRGIDVLRQSLRDRQALPQPCLDRPLCSPPSYELACILEEL